MRLLTSDNNVTLAYSSPTHIHFLSLNSTSFIRLNGGDLLYVPGSDQLPSLAPLLVIDATEPLLLPPHSIGFFTLPRAAVTGCS